jgi:hypothetical protein
VGEASSLQLVFDDCSPDDSPTPPKVDGLRLESQGQSSNISFINGTYSKNVTINFFALLSKQQQVDIPEFTVKTNKGVLTVPAAHFSAAGATVGSTGVALGDAAEAAMTSAKETVWAGEVFDLKYSIDVASAYYPSWGHGTFDWEASPLVTEDWTQPEPFQTRDAAPRSGLTYHTRAIAPAPGRIRTNPTSQLVNLSVGVSGFGFFQQRQYQSFSVPGTPLTIDVRPLPPAPEGFSGAVGDFRIDSKVVPAHVKVGEPVTWTLDLAGAGNWPELHGLPQREAPADFQAIQPKPKLTQPPGKLFDATYSEDVVLVPTRPGTYELPPYHYTYFDPQSGAYKTVTAPGGTVIADPASPASGPGGEQVAPAPGVPQVTVATPTAKAPEAPGSALGDPLPPDSAAPGLLSGTTVAAACAAPFGLAVLLWGALALRRARRTDPVRPIREARVRLSATLASIASSGKQVDPRLLMDWQRDCAALWGVGSAAPQAGAVGPGEWATLWSEADRVIYGRDFPLPSTWCERARAALEAKTVGSFRLHTALHPRNLFPFGVLLLVFAACAYGSDPISAYRGGDIKSAEKSWSDSVAAEPLDWAARHNLSLALGQEDRWGEATAQAAAAYVQNPTPETRRQVIVAGDKAGFIPEPLDMLVQPGPLQALARLGSPALWQRLLVGSAALAALAMVLALLGLYGRLRRSRAAALSLCLVVVAVLGALASVAGFRAYGIAADSRCVVVWRAGTLRSIPTEADIPQKTTPLSAGSVAVVDKTFLGWSRLSFANGESGWVPREEAIFLWRAPPPAAP